MTNTYIPILRNGRNEKKVIKEFNRSSLSNSGSRSLTMTPLVEVTDEDDFEDLSIYEDAGGPLMIDLPQYLADRPNKYQEDVSEIIDSYGSVADFHIEKVEDGKIPVISGSIEPVDYAEYLPLYHSLKSEFDRVAIRLMIRGFREPLTNDQKDSLEELAREVREDDIVLFDLVDNGVTDTLTTDLESLAVLFSENQKAVLNAFDAYNEHPDNQSPEIADDIGASTFGDFGINQRFKPDGGGQPEAAYIRHYLPNESTVEFFVGEDYADAAERLTDWPEWNRSHCDGCRRADRTNNNDANTWSQIKMQHYFSTVLSDQI